MNSFDELLEQVIMHLKPGMGNGQLIHLFGCHEPSSPSGLRVIGRYGQSAFRLGGGDHSPVISHPHRHLRYTGLPGNGLTQRGRVMKRAIEHGTLQVLVETGAAREFRALREGEAWRLELRLGSKWLPVRSRHELVRH